jgi:hypothetical protein
VKSNLTIHDGLEIELDNMMTSLRAAASPQHCSNCVMVYAMRTFNSLLLQHDSFQVLSRLGASFLINLREIELDETRRASDRT